MIYAYENGKFKVKDSQGLKYTIPINRPDFFQVFPKCVIFPKSSKLLGITDAWSRRSDLGPIRSAFPVLFSKPANSGLARERNLTDFGELLPTTYSVPIKIFQ